MRPFVGVEHATYHSVEGRNQVRKSAKILVICAALKAALTFEVRAHEY